MSKLICCSICHEDLFTGENANSTCSTVCGHVFHYVCLIEWLERARTCPHCRKNIPTDDDVIKLNLAIDEKFSSSGNGKVMELERRIELLKKSELDLQNELTVKRDKFRQVSNQIQWLLNTELGLKNELAVKQVMMDEMEKKYKTANLASEEQKEKIVKLEKELLESKEKCRSSYLTNEELKAKIEALEKELLKIKKLANEELNSKNIELANHRLQFSKSETMLKNQLSATVKDLEEAKELYTTLHLDNEELKRTIADAEDRILRLSKFENELLVVKMNLQDMEETYIREKLSKEELWPRIIDLQECVQKLSNEKFDLRNELNEASAKSLEFKKHFVFATKENKKIMIKIGELEDSVKQLLTAKLNLEKELTEKHHKLLEIEKDYTTAKRASEKFMTRIMELEDHVCLLGADLAQNNVKNFSKNAATLN